MNSYRNKVLNSICEVLIHRSTKLILPGSKTLRPRAHYAGEIWKRSFISTVRPAVHTNPSRKRSFISTVRPTVHTNPSRKRSFISTVRPTVHTNPSRKRSFISTVRPIVHTNPSRKWSFSKTLFKLELYFNFISSSISIVDREHFENRAFRKQWDRDHLLISLREFSSSTNPKWADCIKTELYENGGVAMTMWFPCPSVLKHKIQNSRWLLRF